MADGNIIPLELELLGAWDIADATVLLQLAFNMPRPYGDDLKRHLAMDPASWWLGRMGNQAVGMAGFSDFGSCASVGLMVVHPGFQGKGIGGRILRHVLAAADARKIPMLLLDATTAGHPLYLSHGFVEEDKSDLFIRTGTPAPVAVPGREQVRRAKPEDCAAISALDAQIIGADRGRLMRCLLEEFPDRSFVSTDGQGRITGCIFAQSRRIGPWLAMQPADAEALLAEVLALPFASPPELIAPQSNAAARPMLERHGFLYKRSTRHMRRGGEGLLSRRACIYGYASFALG